MKISVIVPTYNRARLVTETIDSILNQTFQDFELIVVDNESTDNTEEIIKSYADERIRYFKHQNHGVIAVNRNYGIDKAQGQYLAFCDDDDLWLPEKLERQMSEFERDKQVGLVCTNGIQFDRSGEKGEMFRTELGDSDFTFESLIWRNCIIISSVLVKKEVINDIGRLDESPEIFAAEDYELWLRVASKYRIKYINLPLIRYRTHASAYRKRYSERIKLGKVIYRKLLSKGILNSKLYRKRIRRANRELLISKLLGYKWLGNCALFLARAFRTIKNDTRRVPEKIEANRRDSQAPTRQ